MNKGNQTRITEFILAGLSDIPEIQPFLFLIFLCTYAITVSGNVCIIHAYNLSLTLHNPMYFYLANFAFLEICSVTVMVPKMLANFLSGHEAISFYGCALQLYCGFLLGTTSSCMLAVMAYDRYNAICHPLLYNTIMGKRVCIQLIVGSWFIGGSNALVHTILIFILPFCGDNKLDRFFCDIPALAKLACADTHLNQLLSFCMGGSLTVCSLMLTVISYIKITSTILSIQSGAGRRKVFSTCTSHFTVVTIFYGSLFFVYLTPKSPNSVYQDRVASVMYITVVPLLNPFIYSLRNSDVKVAIRKLIFQAMAFLKK
ncbi:olfactory receptor 5G9-like [Pelodytes ibericus]